MTRTSLTKGNTSRLLLVCLAALGFVAAGAQPLPGTYQVSWVGNSFSGAHEWVQNFFIHMNVAPDGTCYTWSHWDEGGRKFGIYRNGKQVGNEDVGANSLEVKDKEGRAWKLNVRFVDPEFNEFDIEPISITCDGIPVNFPGLFQPTALAVAKDGDLMVADSGTGPRQQVLFYNIGDKDKPKLDRTFGDYGGISSGVPGVVTPTKFWGIRGVGMDAQGNIYVAMNEMGTILRSFSPRGKLLWQIFGLFFVDVACADPSTDGIDVWAAQEHFKMDYSKSAGQDSRWVGYSLDRHSYPNDPRGLSYVKQQGEHGITSPQIVYLEGKRFLFTGGMFASNFINIFRYDGEVAVPSGTIMQWENGLYRTDLTWPPSRPKGTFIWRDLNGDGAYQADEYQPNTPLVQPGPFWVDKVGNIWMAYSFFRYDFQGLDKKGNPIYRADKVTKMDPPNGMRSIGRVYYDSDRDLLVAAEEASDMRHIGRVFVCRNYLKGNREATVFTTGAGRNAACIAVAGDYAFTGGWQARGKIWVNRLSDGKPMGTFDPGPTVGGVDSTGWIDILTGITAYRRRNGEYLVFVEDDYRGKALLYRWKDR